MARQATMRVIKRTPAFKPVKVKTATDLITWLDTALTHNLHDRLPLRFTKITQRKLVTYGPWLMALGLLIIAPEAMILAKANRIVSFSGFLERVLFDQQAWVLLVMVLINCLLVAEGLSAVAAKKRHGWNRMYLGLVLPSGYVLWQLISNPLQPAAPLLSLVILAACLFTLFDLKTYYK